MPQEGRGSAKVDSRDFWPPRDRNQGGRVHLQINQQRESQPLRVPYTKPHLQSTAALHTTVKSLVQPSIRCQKMLTRREGDKLVEEEQILLFISLTTMQRYKLTFWGDSLPNRDTIPISPSPTSTITLINSKSLLVCSTDATLT